MKRLPEFALNPPAQVDRARPQERADRPRQPQRVLDAQGLCVARGSAVLARDLDLSLQAGEWLLLLGPSGSGKSSLLMTLARMIAPQAGSIQLWDGEHDVPAVCGRVGLIFQNHLLSPHLSALENVTTGRLYRHSWLRTLLGFPEHERREAAGLLERIGLAQQTHRPVRHLSGGQSQRVAVARALFQEPRLILADEPLASLDRDCARQTLALIRERSIANGAAVILSTHDESLHAELHAELPGRVRRLRLGVSSPHKWRWED